MQPQDSGIRTCCVNAAVAGNKLFHNEAVAFVLRRISASEIRDAYCTSATEFALIKQHFEVAMLLLENITNESLKDSFCLKAIESAARVSDANAVNLIIQRISDKSLQENLKEFQASMLDESLQYEFCQRFATYPKDSKKMDVMPCLLQMISDDNARDKWCMKLADAATISGNFELMVQTVQSITDQKLRYQNLVKFFKFGTFSSNLYSVSTILSSMKDEVSKKELCVLITESAAKEGNLDVVKLSSQSIADAGIKNDCCSKALESAVIFGHLDVVGFLIQTISDQKIKDQCRTAAVKSAAGSGHIEVVAFLLQSISNPSERDPSCTKAVESAAKNGHLEIAKYCLSIISDENIHDQCCLKAVESFALAGRSDNVMHFIQAIVNSDIKDQCCVIVAKSAAANLHVNLIKDLLQSICNPVLKDQCCTVAAESAAKNGHLELLKLCVEFIIDLNLRDLCCMKAVEFAAKSHHFEIVKYLVETIIDHNLKNQSCNRGAKSAAAAGHLELVNYLLDKITDQTVFTTCKYEIVAASLQSGNFLVAETIGIDPQWLLNFPLLRQYIANSTLRAKIPSSFSKAVSSMEANQITKLLLELISNGHVALAETLIPYSKIDQPDTSGATALMLAADAGHHELIDRLLDVGASVHAKDNQGRTALSRACQAGHLRAAKVLIEKGADTSHSDYHGMSCAQLADSYGHFQLINLLNSEKETFHQNESTLMEICNPTLNYGMEKTDIKNEDKLSSELHRLLNAAGFTPQRAKCQQAMANFLQGISRIVAQDDIQMTGSYAEGWANSLVQVNGRTGLDSDIDWTVMVSGQLFHLEGGCDGKRSECKSATRLKVIEGHAQVLTAIGSQPAVSVRACGLRPAQDTCQAFACCSFFGVNPLGKRNTCIQLVRATRPNRSNELRLGFSFVEKEIVRKLNGTQGQLFTLLKFIFKKLLPNGLKTYHAKTIVLSMLTKTQTEWKPKNLLKLLKESLDMMLTHITSSDLSPDECMPHFFVPHAKLYFKNAGIGGYFDHTKTRIRDRLVDLRSDLSKIIGQVREQLKPLESENFYFHPFLLMPLRPPPVVMAIRENTKWDNHYVQYADVYSVVYQCVNDLQSESCEKENLMMQLSLLQPLKWCKSAALCLIVMAHLKFNDFAEAAKLIKDLAGHKVQIGWSPSGIANNKYDTHFGHWYWGCPEDSDWAWRFCLPCTTQPHFPFLPEFTRTLLTARLNQPRSSHLYINFRCLSWSLQAELQSNYTTPTTEWYDEMQEDPDLEELYTLAHYSERLEQLQFCLKSMETLNVERRVAMEKQDETKLDFVKTKLKRLQTESSDSVDDLASVDSGVSTNTSSGSVIRKVKRFQLEAEVTVDNEQLDSVNGDASPESSSKLSNEHGTQASSSKKPKLLTDYL